MEQAIVIILALYIIFVYFKSRFGIKSGTLYEHKETGRIVEVVEVKHGFVYYRIFPDMSVFAIYIEEFNSTFRRWIHG